MTTTRQTTGTAQNASGTTIASSAFAATAGGLIFVFVENGNGDGAASVADTAGNTYTSLGTIDDGTQVATAWYCLSSASNASNVVTVTLASVVTGIKSLAWAHYTTDTAGFLYDTTTSVQGGFASRPISASSIATAGPGVVVAGGGEYSVQVETLSDSGSLTLQSNSAGTAAFKAVGLSDAIYSSAQATVTPGINSNVDGRLVVYAASIIEISGPTINTQPADQTVYEGNAASFSVSATTSGGTLHYQWKDDGSNVGTDSNTYGPTPTASDNLSMIKCDVSDDNGTTTTRSAVLRVIPTARLGWRRA